jgi:hypothetical protein
LGVLLFLAQNGVLLLPLVGWAFDGLRGVERQPAAKPIKAASNKNRVTVRTVRASIGGNTGRPTVP